MAKLLLFRFKRNGCVFLQGIQRSGKLKVGGRNGKFFVVVCGTGRVLFHFCFSCHLAFYFSLSVSLLILPTFRLLQELKC